MPRLEQLIECVGSALCEYATAALARLVPFETSLLEVSRALNRRLAQWTPSQVRDAIRVLIASPLETVELAIHDGIAAIRPEVPEEFRETLTGYLETLPDAIRQALRRPGDTEGLSVPEQFALTRSEDWLLFLPDRLPLLKAGEIPDGLDNWKVENFRGFGPHTEVWDGYDDEQPDLSPAILKFISDPALRELTLKSEDAIRAALDLDFFTGLIPMRSAYLNANLPCLEYVYLPSYDLTSFINEARWRGDRPRPDQAAQIVRRVAKIVGKLHRGRSMFVHRGLKLSNILVSPSNEGKVSLWVSDVGWGAVSAKASQVGLDVSQALRRAIHGSHTPLYSSPQVKAGLDPDPRDDVYSIGVIWYQLLCRDPAARPPQGNTWAADFRRYGFNDSQASILHSCLDSNANHRPMDAVVLADLLNANLSPYRNGENDSFRIKGSSNFGEDLSPVRDNLPQLRLRAKRDSNPE